MIHILLKGENIECFQSQSFDELCLEVESIIEESVNRFIEVNYKHQQIIKEKITNKLIIPIKTMKLSKNQQDDFYCLNKLKRELCNNQIEVSFLDKNTSRKASDISTDLEKTSRETLSDQQTLPCQQMSTEGNPSSIVLKSSITQIHNKNKQSNQGERIRQKYLDKLLHKHVWNPLRHEKKNSQYNSITVFDWDDTLLCTTFLSFDGVYDEDVILSDNYLEKISKLEALVYHLLSLALEKGDVYIITNSDADWIKFSSQKYYPNMKPLLDQIKIISARSQYETKYPNDNRMWKIQSFLQLKLYYDLYKITNIVSLGDSNIEMEAAHILGVNFAQASVKTIKFREAPKIEELYKELRLIINQFNEIHSSYKSLSIKIEKK